MGRTVLYVEYIHKHTYPHFLTPALVLVCSTNLHFNLPPLTSCKSIRRFTISITQPKHGLEREQDQICHYAVEERLCLGSSSSCMLSR